MKRTSQSSLPEQRVPFLLALNTTRTRSKRRFTRLLKAQIIRYNPKAASRSRYLWCNRARACQGRHGLPFSSAISDDLTSEKTCFWKERGRVTRDAPVEKWPMKSWNGQRTCLVDIGRRKYLGTVSRIRQTHVECMTATRRKSYQRLRTAVVRP